jgi:hypothetical protein
VAAYGNGYTMQGSASALPTGALQLNGLALPAPAYNPPVQLNPPLNSALTDDYGQNKSFKGFPSSTLPQQPPLTVGQGAKAVLKGLISPLTDPFQSPTKFAIAAGMFLAHAGIIAATGGAAAPVLLAIGAITAFYQAGKGGYELHKAQTPAERKKALTSLGAGVANIVLLGAGAKPALKEGVEGGIQLSKGIDTEKVTPLNATLETVKRVPDSAIQSVQHLRDVKNVDKNVRHFGERQWEDAKGTLVNGKKTVLKIHRDSNGKWHLTAWNLVTQGFRSLSITSMLNLGG